MSQPQRLRRGCPRFRRSSSVPHQRPDLWIITRCEGLTRPRCWCIRKKIGVLSQAPLSSAWQRELRCLPAAALTVARALAGQSRLCYGLQIAAPQTQRKEVSSDVTRSVAEGLTWPPFGCRVKDDRSAFSGAAVWRMAEGVGLLGCCRIRRRTSVSGTEQFVLGFTDRNSVNPKKGGV